MPQKKSLPDAYVKEFLFILQKMHVKLRFDYGDVLRVRWLDYKPYGTVIQGTRILAFKVPLALRICQKLPPQQRFTPELLMKAIPNLKYIIDLTNTNRYYDKTDFTAAGIKYFKIMVNGGEVPRETKVAEFCRVMDTFSSMARDDEIIGVHCTHGINRTGYLICKYLIKVRNWNGHNAIRAFEYSREHRIRRMNYIESLLHDSIGQSHYLPSNSTRRIDSSIVPHLSRLSLQQTNWRDHPPPFVNDNPPSFSSFNQSHSFSTIPQNQYHHNYGNNQHNNQSNKTSHNRRKRNRHNDKKLIRLNSNRRLPKN